MGTLIQDLRYGVRQLVRQRGSSLVAILTLALGIGVSTAIVSLIDATMLRPLPYPDPEQLVTVAVEEQRGGGRWAQPTPSMADMRAWQQATDVLSHVAGAGSSFYGRIADGPEPERLRVAHFTEEYLPMHGVTPLIGRNFSRADSEYGATPVALLGYGYWQRRFGGRADVVGQTIRLDDSVVTIVGVLPQRFNAATPVSTPLQIDPTMFARRGTGRVSVYARLRPGVTLERARAVLSSRTLPGAPGRDGAAPAARASVSSRLDDAIAQYRTTVNVLAGAVGLILLIACVNVAGLLLARGAARRSELALRMSLGAGRGRLMRQLLTEAVVLAIPAGALGVLLAWVSLDALVANIPLTLPANSPVRLNLEVLALTAALLVPTTLVFGLAPALTLSRLRGGATLGRGTRQVGASLSNRGGQLLIGAEVALAVVLVAGAGLMIRSFTRILAVDLGFKVDGLVTMDVLPLERTPAAHTEYYLQLLPRLRTLPGVESVGLVDNFPLGGRTSFSDLTVEGQSRFLSMFEMLPGYLDTLGATLRHGRLLTDADYASRFRGVVLNESAARALFPDGGAVGRTVLRLGSAEPWTVIGVVADLRHGGPLARREREQERLQAFFPYVPTESDLTAATTIVVRTSSSVPALADQLRRTAAAIGPRVLVERIRAADDLLADRVITPRRRMVLLGLLGALGLTLALVGVFGMTGYAVTRRTAEIGVRMAFGARPEQVVATILRDAALPIAGGIAAGLAATLLATRTIESFLFQTTRNDPATLALVAVALGAAGCLAALVPAMRAAHVDPAIALRTE
ncbi:MAG TPA: ABC transporter permease [Vicinamibacterales bacterium]|nr:ABC transporter permease [Vicinamibacterales bacterium]